MFKNIQLLLNYSYSFFFGDNPCHVNSVVLICALYTNKKN